MKFFIFTWMFIATSVTFAYEGPAPLTKIKIDFSAELNGSNGLYSYKYAVSNPASNNGEIHSIRISVSKDPGTDADVSSSGLTYCPFHSAQSAEINLATTPMVPVGASTPNGWSCNYMPEGTFSFGSVEPENRIMPGKSSSGYVLTSYALPGIRNISVDPVIELDLLPSNYDETGVKLGQLEEKVRWTGKTVGPKAPPRVFVALNFLNYVISLKDQSFALGWIKDKGIANSLDAKLNDAKKKITAGNSKTAKNVLKAFQNEVRAQQGKKLTSEAYALLYYNAKYLIDHL